MRYLVVDASVVTKWYLREPGTEDALRLLRLAQTLDYRLTAPDLLLYEVTSVIWKRLRRAELDPTECESILTSLHQAPICFVQPQLLLAQAFSIAAEVGITPYDATYVALAQGLPATAVTADNRLVRACCGTPWSARVAALANWISAAPGAPDR